MQKVTPFLWFDGKAEEAANFYTSIFKNSSVEKITRYGEEGSAAAGQPVGSAMTVEFQIDGQKFIALNGGPHFKFNESVSFVINCEDQAEVDEFWSALTANGGQESQCGWLKDKFGLSWQVVPTALGELLSDPHPEKSGRVMQAMLQMKKIDVKTLHDAYEGKGQAKASKP
jgi:predicted 3-demethylubiquinone-9 3-methyltransferase (glyoxalase superfamily)